MLVHCKLRTEDLSDGMHVAGAQLALHTMQGALAVEHLLQAKALEDTLPVLDAQCNAVVRLDQVPLLKLVKDLQPLDAAPVAGLQRSEGDRVGGRARAGL